MNNLNKNLDVKNSQLSSDSPKKHLGTLFTRNRGLNLPLRLLALLCLSLSLECHAQLTLNGGDAILIQPEPNTLNANSSLTISSLTLDSGDPYLPGDCF